MRQLLKFGWLLSLVLSSTAAANSFNSTAGYYSISAKTSAGTQTLQNFGVYRFIYDIDVAQHFSFKPSYSLYTISGSDGFELGYGTDIEFSYLPFTRNSAMSYQSPSASWQTYEIFQPYVSLSFHQRQYQSIQSNYAGLGLQFGSSYQFSRSIRLMAYVASIYLNGPLSSKVNEFQVAGGIGMQL
ncbi:MAG TPA: hypothetical protein VE954_22455 [Oligoflexus sp.]|uniref:hypothetical protein n=1 Tax=Oligoflexus sp. TaxID=1971216 RepID=UPI002D4C1263|nr:hypothetical protein [Oligoflexus sp.]HYX35871.1 hypothetical protein [Oligoflexus sp.]